VPTYVFTVLELSSVTVVVERFASGMVRLSVPKFEVSAVLVVIVSVAA